MRIEYDIKLGFKDVMIRPKRSTLKSRSQVDLNREFKFLHSNLTWKGIPIMAANMDTVGTFNMASALSKHNVFTAIHKHYSLEEWNSFLNTSEKGIEDYIAVSTGTGSQDIQRLQSIFTKHPFLKFICIDVANGYSENFSHFVSSVREKYPSKTIIAGNVVTADMTQELILSGADVVKVGIGPGSVCTTRIQTGVGYPQLSAVIECADAAHGLGAHIIADGGCTCPGDVAKAFGAGADFVMLGGMLAGHEEGGGKIISENEKQYIEFYGSSSEEAIEKHYGGLSDYRSSEGKKVKIPFRGKLDQSVKAILGGVRSSCTYVGAPSLKQLSKCTTFIRVNQQYNDTFGRV